MRTESRSIIVKAVVGARNVILSDLGGIRLLAENEYDLGRIHRVESLRYSRDLAKSILEGDLKLFDRNDKEIQTGRDLCEMLVILEKLNSGGDAKVHCERTVFSHPDGSESKVIDEISDYVHITRGLGQGLFNYVLESSYENLRNGSGKEEVGSPAGTVWAYVSPGMLPKLSKLTQMTIQKELSFSSWVDAVESAPNESVGKTYVMLDIQANVYYKITFTQWSIGGTSVDTDTSVGKGGFSYVRELLFCDDKDCCSCDDEHYTYVLGSVQPNALNSFLNSASGVSSNKAPIIVPAYSKLKGVALSYSGIREVDEEESQINFPKSAIHRQPAAEVAFGKIGNAIFNLKLYRNGVEFVKIPIMARESKGNYFDFSKISALEIIRFSAGEDSSLYKEIMGNVINGSYNPWSTGSIELDRALRELYFQQNLSAIFPDERISAKIEIAEIFLLDFAREEGLTYAEAIASCEIGIYDVNLALSLYEVCDYVPTHGTIYGKVVDFENTEITEGVVQIQNCQLDEYKDALDKIKSELEVLEGKNEEAQKELDTAKDDESSATATISSLNTEIAALSQTVSESNSTLTLKNRALETTQAEKADLLASDPDADTTAIDAEITSLVSDITILLTTKTTALATIETKRELLATEQSNLSEAQTKIASLEQALKRLQAEQEKAEKELKNLSAFVKANGVLYALVSKDGSYRFNLVPFGCWKVIFTSKEDYEDYRESFEVEVTSSDPTVEADLYVTSLNLVNITVKDEDANPLEATLIFENVNGPEYNVNFTSSFTGLKIADGDYNVSVIAEGYLLIDQKVTITSDTNLDYVLIAATEITRTWTFKTNYSDLTSTTVSGAEVSWVNVYTGATGGSVSGGDGVVTSTFYAGDYEVTVSFNGKSETKVFLYSESGNTDYTRDANPGVANIKVVYNFEVANGQFEVIHVGNALLTLYLPEGETSQAVSDDNGEYRFVANGTGDLYEGTILFDVEKDGFNFSGGNTVSIDSDKEYNVTVTLVVTPA